MAKFIDNKRWKSNNTTIRLKIEAEVGNTGAKSSGIVGWWQITSSKTYSF